MLAHTGQMTREAVAACFAELFRGKLKRSHCHASTHLWAIAHELFPEEAAAKAGVEPLLHQLKHGQEADVLNQLQALPAQRQAAILSPSGLLPRENPAPENQE